MARPKSTQETTRKKLGKKPATHDPRDLQFAHYRELRHPTKLQELFGRHCPKPPAPTPGPPSVTQDIDNLKLLDAHGWGMLGNDQYGDCVFAGADHEHMLWNKIAGTPVAFTADNALADYGAVTGFNPSDPNSDQGTDVHQALDYRKKTGVVDSKGTRHTIGAYLALEVANTEHLRQAAYWFDAVGIGFEFPSSAMTQFDQGKPWTVVAGASIEGGHYVPIIGFDAQWLYLVTWGSLQLASWDFYKKYTDESWAILSPEFLKAGKSPEGFDITQLQADLGTL